LATTKLALYRAKGPRIGARIAITLCISHPISPYALIVDPYLTLTHAF